MSGKYLANAVTHQQIRTHSPALPELAEGIAHRKQNWLAGTGLIKQSRSLGLLPFPGYQKLEQRLFQLLIQQGRNPFKSLKKGGMSQQLLAHAKGLRTLSGEQPSQLAEAP